jgi:hypothetical protein
VVELLANGVLSDKLSRLSLRGHGHCSVPDCPPAANSNPDPGNSAMEENTQGKKQPRGIGCIEGKRNGGKNRVKSVWQIIHLKLGHVVVRHMSECF